MEALNIQLSPFFQWLLKTSIQGSLLICLILLVKSVLRGRLPIRWHYYLWLLLLVRLALPWAPQSRFSMFNLIPQYSSPESTATTLTTESTGDTEVHTTVNYETTRDTSEQTMVEQQTVQPESATPEPKPTSAPVVPGAVSPDRSDSTRPVSVVVVRILPLAWLLGAMALGGYVAVRNFDLWRTIKRERPVTDSEILELLEDCKMQMNVQTIVGVIVTNRVKSPALFGFIRPRLLLPQGLIEALDFEELHYVFLHELAHLKRRDIYLGWLVSLLQVMHWFNPLIWFALRRMRTDQEMACDGLVLSTMKTDYGRTIVNLFERFSQVSYVPSIAGILEEPSQLERRIKMIAKFKNNSYQWSPLAVILIVILACVSLPDARRTKASGVPTRQPSPNIKLQRVWSSSYPVTDGEPSPDGRFLSYTDWETGDLAIYEISVGRKQRLTNKGSWNESDDCAYSSAWSPDGRQIVYCWQAWEQEDISIDLRVIGLDDSKPRILYSADEMEWARVYDWSPDGGQILACLLGKGDKGEIALVSSADGSVNFLKAAGKLRDWPENMSFSPDGRFIVYSYRQKEDSRAHDISVMSVDGSHEIPLVEHPAHDFVLGWAPDGKNILFASDRTGIIGIWLVAVADGKPQGAAELVKPNAGKFQPLGLTKDGSYYYGLSRGSDDVYVATLDPRTGKIIAPLKKAVQRYEGSNMVAAYSPDGKYLAHIYRSGILSRRHSDNILCIRSLETGQERESPLSLDGISKYASLRWSPDGRSILVSANDKDNAGIYMIDVQTGAVKYLVKSHACVWSADGKSILYPRANRDATIVHILVRDLETGEEKRLLPSASDKFVFNMAISPDGQRLALRCIRPTSLKILPVAGGQARELPEFEKVATVHKPIAWTADSQYILFSGKEPGGGKHPLYRISVETGKTEKLGLQMNRYHGLSTHPDGRRILVSGSESGSEFEVWAMENFLPEAPVAKPEPMTTVRRIESDWGTFASLSPDGNYLCDVDWDTENIAVLELATGKIRQLTSKSSDDACYPLDSAISPDSREVAYLWWDPNKRASSLHVVGLDGSERRLLCKGKYPMPRTWSADGQKILAIVSENDVQQMVWVSASDGSIQHIASFNGEGLGYPGKFDISPDGRFIAYDRPQAEDASKRDIVVFDLNNNVETFLVEHPADDKLLGWTPDGKHVVFVSDRAASWDAWLLLVAGGKPQGFPKLAKHGIGNVRPIGFTPYGSYYYAHERVFGDVFTARLDLETGEVVSEPAPVRQTGATTSHDWSPDGQYLAYCERRPDGSRVIHIRTLATGRERTLADNIPYIRWLRWSLDGRSILIDGARRGDSQGVIFTIDVQTGKRSELVRSETEVLIRPEMSPDGRTLYYVRNDPKSRTMRLMARDLEGASEKELLRIDPPARLTGSALSSDGQRLILSIVPNRTGTDGPVLKILYVAGGEPRELIQFDKSEKLRAVGVTWMPDSQNVLFWKWFQGFRDLELWRISAEGGEPRRLCSRKTFGHMRVHPDGQRVAFNDRSTTRELWVMENFLPKAVASAEK